MDEIRNPNPTSADRALRISQEKHRILFETMTQGVIYQDAAGYIISANPAAQRILGVDSDKMLGRTWYDSRWGAVCEDGSDLPGTEHPATRASHSAIPVENEVIGIFNPRDNDYRWVLVSAVPQFYQGESAPYQVCSTFTDITERKRSEEERRSLQEQLAQAHKMESLGRLAGGIAHEFNNLLAPIIAYSEIILRDLPVDSPHSGRLNEMLRAASKARDLTQQLLILGRKQPLEMKAIDLNKIVAEFQEILRNILRENIGLKIGLDRELPLIEGDASQLELVLTTLVVNSQDAISADGTIDLETKAAEFDAETAQHAGIPPGRYAELRVKDSGSGMEKDSLSRMFEPFFSTKGDERRPGLGLAAVYGIVRQHRGHIRVNSSPGEGTAIQILFPCIPEPIRTDSPAAALTNEPSRSETILLVEDSEVMRNLAAGILKTYGYTALVAKDPNDAIEICGRHEGKIDLLLTDMVMPVMNGKDLYHKMLASRPELKVLYMSGYPEQGGEPREQGLFLQKPFSVNSFVKKLRSLLENNGETADAQ